MHPAFASAGTKPVTAANRFGLDYALAARALGPPVVPIVDSHAHIAGPGAAAIFGRVMDAFGVVKVRTMTRYPEARATREALGSRAEFIAFQDFRHPDKYWSLTEGYLADIQRFHDEYGSTMIKLWNAPRMYELFQGDQARDLIAFDSPWRVRHAQLAQSLGMAIMVHVADPDTWFSTRYADAVKFPPKREHYPALESMMDRFAGPWIAAHMGGYAEDLDFLDGLLERHPNLSLDTSATKWVVRELSKHPRSRVLEFFSRWTGRILFGSDIVTTDEHLTPKEHGPWSPDKPKHPMADLADNPDAAFDLYASRYLALRLLFESTYEGESFIADPDLKMVDPGITEELPAPRFRGLGLERDALGVLYGGARV